MGTDTPGGHRHPLVGTDTPWWAQTPPAGTDNPRWAQTPPAGTDNPRRAQTPPAGTDTRRAQTAPGGHRHPLTGTEAVASPTQVLPSSPGTWGSWHSHQKPPLVFLHRAGAWQGGSTPSSHSLMSVHTRREVSAQPLCPSPGGQPPASPVSRWEQGDVTPGQGHTSRLLPFEGEHPLRPPGAVCPSAPQDSARPMAAFSRPIYGSHQARDPPLGLGKAPGMWPGGTGHAGRWALLRCGDSASLGDTGAVGVSPSRATASNTMVHTGPPLPRERRACSGS